MPLAHIAVFYQETFPSQPFKEFCGQIEQKGLNLQCESTPDHGPFACIEWLMPSAIIVFLTKPYFESFLQEAGKDHYNILKKSISNLFSKPPVSNTSISLVSNPPGKIESKKPKYSMVYSIMSEVSEELTVKLLLQNEFTAEQNSTAINCFLEILPSIHNNTLNPDSIKGIGEVQLLNRTLLVAYNPEIEGLEALDPLPKNARRNEA